MNILILSLWFVFAWALVGAAWCMARALNLAVKAEVEKIKRDRKGTPGVGSPKNRYRLPLPRNRLGHFCGVSEESPITPVVDKEQPANYSHEDSSGGGVEPKPEELPYLEQTAISESKAGIHFPKGEPANIIYEKPSGYEELGKAGEVMLEEPEPEAYTWAKDYEEALSKTKAGVHYPHNSWEKWIQDHDQAIKHLEQGQHRLAGLVDALETAEKMYLDKRPAPWEEEDEIPSFGGLPSINLENQIRKADIVHEIGLLKDLEKKHWENICDLDERMDALENLTKVTGKHGKEIYTDIKPRVQNLETNVVVTAKEISDILTLIERLTEMALGDEEKIAELTDKLNDSIFILYGGKKTHDG